MLALALPFSGPAQAQAHAHASPCAHASHHAAPDHAHAAHGGKLCTGNCFVCCLGAALAPSALPRPLPDRPASATIPFHARALPRGWAALPERPPQFASA